MELQYDNLFEVGKPALKRLARISIYSSAIISLLPYYVLVCKTSHK
jgi:hypothetical protein